MSIGDVCPVCFDLIEEEGLAGVPVDASGDPDLATYIAQLGGHDVLLRQDVRRE